MSLLHIDEVVKDYPLRAGAFGRADESVRALDGVSFDVAEGQTFGLVGESGCGKSTLSRIVLGLEAPTSGRIEACGRDPQALRGGALKAWRRQVQIVAQDPAGALPARMRVGRIVEEPLRVHGVRPDEGRAARAAELLARVGLSARHARAHPHELSGGQRQRVAIARALALDPRLLVCDEPVSALDVSVQAQVLDLLRSLQERLGLTYLFISHDLGVIRHMAETIGVMYRGSLVERGPAAELYARPRHPYTRELLDAIPSVRRARRRRAGPGSAPVADEPAEQGCRFRPRCPLAVERCVAERPLLREVAPGRWSACHRAEEVS